MCVSVNPGPNVRGKGMTQGKESQTSWMSRKELAQHLGVSIRTITRKVDAGEIERRSADKVERDDGKGKMLYRTRTTSRVLQLVQDPPPQSSPKAPLNPNTTHHQLVGRFEEIVLENARMVAEHVQLNDTISSLRDELEALREDHKALWSVVGELTQEAFELECENDRLRSTQQPF